MFIKLGEEYLNLSRVVRVRFARVGGQTQAHVDLDSSGAEGARARYTGHDAEALRDALDNLGVQAGLLAAALASRSPERVPA